MREKKRQFGNELQSTISQTVFRKADRRKINSKYLILNSICWFLFLFLPLVVYAQIPQIEMIFVKGGTFYPSVQNFHGNSEENVHRVQVNDFYIGKYEVTQTEWEAVMNVNPSYFHSISWEDMSAYIKKINERNGTHYAIPCEAEWAKAALPVEDVSWNDVQEFIRILNELTGENYRLPTESEWEYAARGGSESRGYKYSGSDVADEVAWLRCNSNGQTHPVGVKKPNELGIYDMSGNVWEWCSDKYGKHENYLQTDPKTILSGPNCVYRGGGWNGVVQRISICKEGAPDDACNHLGFRLARSVK